MTRRRTVIEGFTIVFPASCVLGLALFWTWGPLPHPETTPCWFLTPRVEQILVEDLVMWTEHTAHNPDATMQEWYDLRVPEVVAMNNSMGVTAAEVTACFDTLHPKENPNE